MNSLVVKMKQIFETTHVKTKKPVKPRSSSHVSGVKNQLAAVLKQLSWNFPFQNATLVGGFKPSEKH